MYWAIELRTTHGDKRIDAICKTIEKAVAVCSTINLDLHERFADDEVAVPVQMTKEQVQEWLMKS